MAARRQKRYLIVNADDFGQSRGMNRGIIEAHEHGIVTSASLMVRWPAATEAAAYARKHPSLSLGLHVDFSEWAYRKGNWVELYEVIPEDDITAVAKEASRQLAAFRRLVAEDPTHIDSHQHAHLEGPARSVAVKLAQSLGVPLRSLSPKIRYCGSFYGQGRNGWPAPDLISVASLIKILASLPPGFTELGCHPGRGKDLDSMYLRERAKEIMTLCDPRVRAAIENLEIQLSSFHDFLCPAERRTTKNPLSGGIDRQGVAMKPARPQGAGFD